MTSTRHYRFGKEERLKRRKLIQQVFSEGRSRGKYPLRLLWLASEKEESEAIFQIGFTVPRRTFRKASDRNLLKRRMREAYRLNKHLLEDITPMSEGRRYAMFLVYTARESHSYRTIGVAVRTLLERLVKDEFGILPKGKV